MKKTDTALKALIIAYYWEPAGGPGVQRWVKFVKYMREFGVHPIVFVPENPHYPIIDPSIKAEIPKDIEIIKFPISEPYKWATFLSKKKTKQISSGIITTKKSSLTEKMLLAIRGNFFIPDARIGWVKPSVDYLQNYLTTHKVDVIITTGPPHSLHLIGMKLKQKLSIPWLADFRDPWTTIHYHTLLRLGKKAKQKHIQLEKEVLQNADAIVVTSVSTQTEFQTKTTVPVHVITNGYDTVDMPVKGVLDNTFSFAHIGSLLSERNPIILWKVLSELVQEDIEFATNLSIKLVGAVSQDVLKSIKKYNLSQYVELTGYVSHNEAIAIQNQSQVLLLIESNRPETKAIIPGKLFEYLQAKRPILAILPQGSDVISILRETHAGVSFTYEDKEGLLAKIKEFYTLFKKDELYMESKNIQRFSRRSLTQSMVNILKSTIKTKTPN